MKSFKATFIEATVTLTVLGLTLLATSSFATSNPQIRECHRLGGEFLVAESRQDQFGFCKFDEAIIGAMDLVRQLDSQDTVGSIITYRNFIQTCEPYGQFLTYLDLEKKPLKLCIFEDGSALNEQALSAGRYSPLNIKLTAALGLD